MYNTAHILTCICIHIILAILQELICNECFTHALASVQSFWLSWLSTNIVDCLVRNHINCLFHRIDKTVYMIG